MRLLDLLNSRNRLLDKLRRQGWSPEELEVAAAQIACCRRRVDTLNWAWRQERVRQRLDPENKGWRVDVQESDADVIVSMPDPLLFPFKGRLLPGRKAADWLARHLVTQRRHVPIPEWPEPPPHHIPSSRVRALFDQWRIEWERLRGARVWRCEQPECGRYFVARTADRDCRYCRRAASKATRWRRRRAAQARINRA